ncbi:hypothetical protein L0128_21780 [candidate division KSB1 bacterium]|nr:hypothetical protein [candidate division KSB1 bacterium]
MIKKAFRAKTDPELIRQLDAAQGDSELVEAVITLRASPRQIIPPERVEELVQKILSRASQNAGSKAKEVNVLHNLGVLVVSAKAEFIRTLLNDPAIASAMSNRKMDSAIIAPRHKRPLP